MTSITATELELLECFEVEPHLLDAESPWIYNDALYSVLVDGWSVSFAVQPSYRDIRLIVQRGEHKVFELNAVGVVDVRVSDTQGMNAVEVVLSERALLRLQLRPVFGITQRFTE